MTKQTIRAIQCEYGYLELLDPVELPKGQVITVTFGALEDMRPDPEVRLPEPRPGSVKGALTRDEIYEDYLDRVWMPRNERSRSGT